MSSEIIWIILQMHMEMPKVLKITTIRVEDVKIYLDVPLSSSVLDDNVKIWCDGVVHEWAASIL